MTVQDCQLMAAANHLCIELSMQQRLAKHLGYKAGTADVAVVLKQTARIDHSANGLCIASQLKRQANRENH